MLGILAVSPRLQGTQKRVSRASALVFSQHNAAVGCTRQGPSAISMPASVSGGGGQAGIRWVSRKTKNYRLRKLLAPRV